MKPLKILILHASAGHGHERAAHATMQALKAANPSADIKMHDALDLMPFFWGRLYSGIYIFLIKYIPSLWALLYNGHDFVALSYLLYPLRRMFNFAVSKKLVRLIADNNPDAIICTHFMPSEVVAYLKKRDRYFGLLVTVITDFIPHYFWLSRYVDYYISGTDETTKGLLKRRINRARIVESGIPIDSACAAIGASIKSDLGLDPQRFTILLTNGGAGIGAVENLCRALCQLNSELQIVVITGTNRALKEKLDTDFTADCRVKICGFVDNMPEWIAASDLVIGKSGGLTVAETMAIGKPMILLAPVPGQEVHNAKILSARGAALLAKTPQQAIIQVSLLLDHPHLLEIMRQNAKLIGKPASAQDLAKFVINAALSHEQDQPLIDYTLNPRAA